MRSDRALDRRGSGVSILSLGAATDLAAYLYVAGLILVLFVVPAAVTLLKGHVAAFAVGLITMGIVWMVAAVRLARPGSWWARTMYDARKIARSRARYGP
jgi:hypothetical protein